MKKTVINLFLLLGITLLLMAGCKERQVTKVMNVPEQDLAIDEATPIDVQKAIEPIESIEPDETTETVEEDSESDEKKDENEAPSTKTSDEVEEVIDSSSDEIIDEKAETVIVAKSENLEEIDERALMLKELDALLEDVLTKLDAVEEDDLSDDNLFDEGGD